MEAPGKHESKYPQTDPRAACATGIWSNTSPWPAPWHAIATDGKPLKAGQYLVFADRCQMFIRTYDPARGADFDDEISHWMELPAPPGVPNAIGKPLKI